MNDLIAKFDEWLVQHDQHDQDERVAEPFGVDPGVEDAVEEEGIFINCSNGRTRKITKNQIVAKMRSDFEDRHGVAEVEDDDSERFPNTFEDEQENGTVTAAGLDSERQIVERCPKCGCQRHPDKKRRCADLPNRLCCCECEFSPAPTVSEATEICDDYTPAQRCTLPLGHEGVHVAENVANGGEYQQGIKDAAQVCYMFAQEFGPRIEGSLAQECGDRISALVASPVVTELATPSIPHKVEQALRKTLTCASLNSDVRQLVIDALFLITNKGAK